MPSSPRTTRRRTSTATISPASPAQSAPSQSAPSQQALRVPAARQEATPGSDATTTTFAALGVPAPLVAVLTAQGITTPFAIQAATVASGLAGKDVLGRARTGAGKTLAFSLPMVARLAASPAPRRAARRPRAVVLAPTRELANQIAAVVAPLAGAVGLTHTTVFGGVGQNPQVTALKSGVDIVIACPGRLEDLVRQGHADLGGVEITVLDEADHMADLGFLPGVRRLLDLTPKNSQRLLFSATLDGAVDVLVKRFMRDPQRISVDSAAAAPVEMEHHVLEVSATDKAAVVRELAAGEHRTLLFTRTKHQAKKLARTLTTAGTPAVDLHGNLTQGARERNLASFSEGRARVLVATDIAARGIHVDDVALVVHVDPPADHKAYLHRSGRTARAGSSGVVVTVATQDQRSDVTALARAAAISPTRTRVTAGHPLLRELTGPLAELVEAPPAPVKAAPQARSAGSGDGTASRSRSRGARGRSSAAPAQNAAPARSGGAARSGGTARTSTAARTAGTARSGGSPKAGSVVAYSSTTGVASSHSAASYSARSGGRRAGGRRPS